MRIAQKRAVCCVSVVISAVIVVGGSPFMSGGDVSRGLTDGELSMICGTSEADGCDTEIYLCNLVNECTGQCYDAPQGDPIETPCDGGQAREYAGVHSFHSIQNPPPNGKYLHKTWEMDCVYLVTCLPGTPQAAKYCVGEGNYSYCTQSVLGKSCAKCVVYQHIGELPTHFDQCAGCP